MLSTYLSGGLNHQIEHHMFPAVAVHHFPLIAKKIQRVCEKHGVPYQNLSYPSLVASCHASDPQPLPLFPPLPRRFLGCELTRAGCWLCWVQDAEAVRQL